MKSTPSTFSRSFYFLIKEKKKGDPSLIEIQTIDFANGVRKKKKIWNSNVVEMLPRFVFMCKFDLDVSKTEKGDFWMLFLRFCQITERKKNIKRGPVRLVRTHQLNELFVEGEEKKNRKNLLCSHCDKKWFMKTEQEKENIPSW